MIITNFICLIFYFYIYVFCGEHGSRHVRPLGLKVGAFTFCGCGAWGDTIIIVSWLSWLGWGLGCIHPFKCRWVIMGCDTKYMFVGVAWLGCRFPSLSWLSLIPWVVPLFGWLVSWGVVWGFLGRVLWGLQWVCRFLPWLCLYGALYALHWALFAVLGLSSSVL